MASARLRPEQPEDTSFNYRLFAQTRSADLEPLALDPVQKDALLRQQFQLQAAHYRERFPAAAFSIIELESAPIGRLYLNRSKDEILVIDITVSPEHRNRGIGRELLQRLLAEASARGQVVRLHVERSNPARRLYHRLGFRELHDDGVYLQMEWRTAAPEAEDFER
jgi:ribosomal protein S18 acetylase RimI-like enzyme